MPDWRTFLSRLLGRGDRRAGTSNERSPAAPSRLIVGLGNPGDEYALTRHNVGFRVVDLLAARFGGEWTNESGFDAVACRVEIESEACLLLKPQSFMNRSGAVLAQVFDRWSAIQPGSALLVIYDDMDLPTGRLRLRPRGGSGGHRGIGNILDQLETKEIARLRVGVGHPGLGAEALDWVLEAFSSEEEATVLPDLLARAADCVEMAIRDGVTPAMGQFNAKG